MPTKKFQAESMMEALEMVQKELGPDAIVLSSREVPLGPPWQVWKKPGIEVVAMSPDKKPGLVRQGLLHQAPSSDRQTTRTRANTSITGANRDKNYLPSKQTPTKSAVIKKTSAEGIAPTKKMYGQTSGKSQPGYSPGQQSAPKANSWVKNVSDPSVAVMENTEVARQEEPQNSDFSDFLEDEKENLPAGLAQSKLQLLAQGLDRGLVNRLMKTSLSAFTPAILNDENRSKILLHRQLEAGLKVENNFLIKSGKRVICLVGASGSGKTTTISKLAVHFTQSMGKKVVWICADTVRAGAIAETRAYADAIGVSLKLVYTPDDLTETMRMNQNADILLIDTPGYNPCDEAQMVELGKMLTRLPEKSTYLVAPATTKEADLLQAVASLGLFKIRGLLITKLDETYSFGSVYNFVYQSQLPLALFSNGKEIFGDLKQAEVGKLVSAIFGKGWE